MRLTAHAQRRSKERLGLAKPPAHRIAARALARGQAPAAFSGSLRHWLDDLARQQGADVRLYGEHVFLFMEETLVTVIHVPGRYRRVLRALRRES